MSKTPPRSLRPQASDKEPQTKKAVRVAASQLGYGVFARQRFEPEQIVGEVTGALVEDPDYESNYCMELSDTVTLEPGPPFRYLNHSCEPNCTLISDDSNDDGYGPRLLVEAIRPIEPGDELTIDYAWPAEDAIRCACQSAKCRGWIVDVDELEQLNLSISREMPVPPASAEPDRLEAPTQEISAAG